jgi:carbamoyl-phosphate synthase large subunit
MNVLITSAGRRVSLVRAFQKELKRHFPEGQVVACDANPVLAAACQVADRDFSVPLLSEPGYMDALLEQCVAHRISLVVPTIDTELLELARHRKAFEAKGIHVVSCSEAFVRICRDKREIHRFFEDYGIAVAREFPKDAYTLPLFIKPVNGSRSVDTFLIREERELRDYHRNSDHLMFLEYLDHQEYDEYTCDLYYGRDHELKCVVPRKRLEVRDGEVNKGLAVRNALIPFLREKLGYLEGAVGCLTTQFFLHRDNGQIYGIEINPRFGGGFPLTYGAGANYPGWLIREYLLGEAIAPQFDCWEDRLLMLRYDAEIWVHGYTD